MEEDTGTRNYQFLVLSIDFFFFFLSFPSVPECHYTHATLNYIYIYIYMHAGAATIHWKFVFYRPVITNVMQKYVESSTFSGI